MKQVLNFSSEGDFQNFFGQLSCAEFPGFQAVEGSGGDMGFDGILGDTAFQVFYPSKRDTKNYIQKIDNDVDKVIKSKVKLGLEVKRWIFVVPEDLRMEVVAHLQNKSKSTGLECTYWGSTKLSELVNKHPHIKEAFPNLFLPPVSQGLNNLTEQIASGQKPRVMTSVEIISDEEFRQQRQLIHEEYIEKTQSFMRAHGTASSAYLAADMAYKKEADKKVKELMMKKERSDRAYQLELADISDYWDNEVKKINEDMAKRGIFQSGIRLKAVGDAEVKRKRDIEKLNLKFGKNNPPA